LPNRMDALEAEVRTLKSQNKVLYRALGHAGFLKSEGGQVFVRSFGGGETWLAVKL
jgi:hypothetical protein